MLTLDFSSPWQFGFQDPATPIMEGLISLHHHIFFFLIIIFIFVLWIILNTLYYYSYNETIFLKKLYENSKFLFLTQYWTLIFKINKQNHHTFLEIIWTIIPSFVLIFIAIPSFSLLYCMDEVLNPVITLKIMGRQWYWCYEYVLTMHRRYTLEHVKKAILVDFTSYLVPVDELTTPGNFRLLEVDNRVVLPIKTHIRLLISSGDVLHAWGVPSMGVKMDAVPGRLNQALLFIKRPGLFYGQCSELCGINHGFMPIVIQAVSYNDFLTWYHAKLLNA